MSREVGITAVNPDGVMVDGKSVFVSNYTKEWIEKVVDQNPDALVEGRLIIACSYDAHRWILKAVAEAQRMEQEVCITDEDDIFATQEILQEVLFRYWVEWHDQDDRWSWSQDMIREFFDQYKWAIIYIDVY